jgi:hypothetical protein
MLIGSVIAGEWTSTYHEAAIHNIWRQPTLGSRNPRRAAPFARPPELHAPPSRAILSALRELREMTWFIGRTEALSDPLKARRKAMERLRALAELDDPESLVVPILLDAILMAESYRGARHQISFLPELTRDVDALLRELTILDKSKEWAGS